MIDLEEKAYKAIANAKGTPLILIGHSLELRSQLEKDPGVSNLVESICSDCNSKVLSSELKEKIKELTKDSGQDAKLLCMECLIKIMKDVMPDQVKAMNQHGKIFNLEKRDGSK